MLPSLQPATRQWPSTISALPVYCKNLQVAPVRRKIDSSGPKRTPRHTAAGSGPTLFVTRHKVSNLGVEAVGVDQIEEMPTPPPFAFMMS